MAVPTEPVLLGWQPPLVPETYDRRPLTAAERATLATLVTPPRPAPTTDVYRNAVACLDRLERPLADLVRHCGDDPRAESARSFYRTMRREMHWSGVAFWAWTPTRWLEALSPSAGAFHARHGAGGHGRLYLKIAAYLFGGVTDLLRARGVLSPVAAAVFGADAVTGAVNRLSAELDVLGYATHRCERVQFQAIVSSLFLANRNPSLEAVTAASLTDLVARRPHWPEHLAQIAKALTRLGILPPAPAAPAPRRPPVPAVWEGVAAPWRAWTTAWYEQESDLSDVVRRNVIYRLQAIGRWLRDQAPTTQTPADWTEELALRFRHDVTT